MDVKPTSHEKGSRHKTTITDACLECFIWVTAQASHVKSPPFYVLDCLHNF